jgi:hypothetical protein
MNLAIHPSALQILFSSFTYLQLQYVYGHTVCTYTLFCILYLFYFIFKTDSMPKESLFRSSILAGKQYLLQWSNAQTVKINSMKRWSLVFGLICVKRRKLSGEFRLNSFSKWKQTSNSLVFYCKNWTKTKVYPTQYLKSSE